MFPGFEPSPAPAPRVWSWHVEPLPYKAMCVQCSKSLRLDGGAVVKWTDGALYHVGCVLDKLATHAWNNTG